MHEIYIFYTASSYLLFIKILYIVLSWDVDSSIIETINSYFEIVDFGGF